jgi:hypothetical protein
MSIDSYDDLQDKMAKYLKRADLSALLPDFISLAEEYLNDNVFTRARRSSFVITPYGYNVPLPSGWERVIDVWYDGRKLSFYSSEVDSEYVSGSNAIGSNTAMVNGYQIIGNMLTFTPAQNQLGLKLQVDYYETLEPLSESNTSNWLLEDSSMAYLFASLYEAALYVRDDARAQLWQNKRDEVIASLVTKDERAKYPAGGLAMRKAR